MKKTIMGIQARQESCTDKNCPFHSDLAVKQELFEGVVIKKDTHHSATIEWYRSQKVPKYERFEVKRSRIRTHNPACISAEVGEKVLIARTRPISKTKHHVILQILVPKGEGQ